MLKLVLWFCFALILVFAIMERAMKSAVTNEAIEIFKRQNEKIFPPTLNQLLVGESLKIHNSALGNFQRYFICNAGIFLFPLHPGLATFSVFHSLCCTISLIAAVIAFFFTSKFQSVFYIILFINFFLIFSPAWYPLAGRDDANIERAFANHFRTFSKQEQENYRRNKYIFGTDQKNDQFFFDMCRKIVYYEIEQRSLNV